MASRGHPVDELHLAIGRFGNSTAAASAWTLTSICRQAYTELLTAAAVPCCLQIQRLMLSFPKTSHGYQYIFISLGTALLLGLIIYGIPVWTMV